MNADVSEQDIDFEDVARKMRMLEVFLKDIIEDPSLAELLPAESRYLDFFARGSRPEIKPDFQTSHVDVYVVPEHELPAAHLVR